MGLLIRENLESHFLAKLTNPTVLYSVSRIVNTNLGARGGGEEDSLTEMDEIPSPIRARHFFKRGVVQQSNQIHPWHSKNTFYMPHSKAFHVLTPSVTKTMITFFLFTLKKLELREVK